MSLHVGQAKLTSALKDLAIVWSQVRPSWRDEVARSFENDVIADIDHRVRSALGGMQQMQETLQRVRRDCA